MSKEGFITISRKLIDWEWYQNPNMVHLWIHLLIMANYSESRFEGILIKRGQFVTSLDKLSMATGLTIQQVRTCLEKLKTTLDVTCKSTNHFTIITICKYDIYQSNGKSTQHAIQQPQNAQQKNNIHETLLNIAIQGNGHSKSTYQITNQQQTDNNNRTIEQYKEIKNKENAPSPIAGIPPHRREWLTYPLPPSCKNHITEKECIRLLQIPEKDLTTEQKGQIYNYTTGHWEFESSNYKVK